MIPLLVIPASAQESNIIRLIPTDDAFVIANLSDPDDVEGFQTINTGNFDFLKSWYAWNVSKHQEQIITNSYLKFNLSDIESDKVINAQLKLVPQVLKTTFEVPPHLELSKVDTNDWNETEINYSNKPSHDEENFIVNTIISNPANKHDWYTWDITELVKQSSGSKLSVVYYNSDIINNSEEVVSFYSKEAKDPENFPVLEIKYVAEILLIPSSLQENETDYTLAAIVGVLVVAAGIGIFITLILRKKSLKQLAAKQITTPSEKPRTDSKNQKPSQEIKCKSCGKTLAEDFKVCPYCGFII